MTPQLTPRERIKQSAKAIAFLTNPAFGLDQAPGRAKLIADHESQMAQDIRLVIPPMKETRS
ncbi:hypothetical protein [Asaia bogorensis]|uniref:hypothetical protein n=1 Tax=Asaia bogorensis TaxID=91915 RepID=UPI0028589F96|nr:hypothetical protein [Asaia bogorensis]MDR6182002.1 hypothetical protein [Asaia bogorensis NBRC 16594]